MDESSGRSRLFGYAVLAVAFFEIAAHIAIRARVPKEQDWEAAVTFVEASFEEGDRIVAAPTWVDPLVRHHFGHLIAVSDAAANDLSGVERLWVVSIRGARSRWAPERPANEVQRFGRVQVARWPLNEPRVIYDFVSELRRARVQLVQQGQPRACPWRRARPGRGGLDTGAMSPLERFQCDRKRPWLWVGPTVMEDLDFRPRRCIWQHPAGAEPVRVTFEDVPLGDRLVFYAGVYYRDERMRAHGPALLRVLIDEEPIGHILHRDGNGWARLEVTPPPGSGDSLRVTIETTAENPHRRTLCWSGVVEEDPTR